MLLTCFVCPMGMHLFTYPRACRGVQTGRPVPRLTSLFCCRADDDDSNSILATQLNFFEKVKHRCALPPLPWVAAAS